MEKSIEQLQLELQERMKELSEQHVEKAAALIKEQVERSREAQKERDERMKYIKGAEKRALRLKLDKDDAEKLRIREENEKRVLEEQKQNGLDELVRKNEEQKELMAADAIRAEHLEELRQKTIDEIVDAENREEVYEEVDSHVLTGEAADGTCGLETGPEMSTHLKRILRIG